jgi:hypothetical protein
MHPRISYANVVSTLALVLVMGGGAYAATQLPKDSVGSKQVKNSSLRSKDVKDGNLRAADLRAGAIDAEVAGTPMGGDLAGTFPDPTLRPSLLAGLASDAELANGLDGVQNIFEAALADAMDDVVLGDRDDAALNLPGGSGPQALVHIPGLVSVTAACSSAGPLRGLEVNVTNEGVGSLIYTLRQYSVAPPVDSFDSDTLLPGTDADYVFPPDAQGDNVRYLRLVVLNGRLLEVEVSAVTNTLAAGCRVRGSAFLDGNGAI